MNGQRNPQVMRGRKLMISITIDPDQVAAVDKIADERRTSRAQIFREAIDLFLLREEERAA